MSREGVKFPLPKIPGEGRTEQLVPNDFPPKKHQLSFSCGFSPDFLRDVGAEVPLPIKSASKELFHPINFPFKVSFFLLKTFSL